VVADPVTPQVPAQLILPEAVPRQAILEMVKEGQQEKVALAVTTAVAVRRVRAVLSLLRTEAVPPRSILSVGQNLITCPELSITQTPAPVPVAAGAHLRYITYLPHEIIYH
jgi:hypothetical protein